MKKIFIFIGFSVATLFLFIVGSNNLVYASRPENITESVITDTDLIDVTLNGSPLSIFDYPNIIGGNYSIGNYYFNTHTEKDKEGNEVIVTEKEPNFPIMISRDDHITKIIPKDEFLIQGDNIIIGKEYGYFKRTTEESGLLITTILLFDIETNTNLISNNDQINVSLKSLFEYKFMTIEKNKKVERDIVSSTAAAYYEFIFSDDFSERYAVVPYLECEKSSGEYGLRNVISDDFFINDVAFSASIYNENNLNPWDTNYNPYYDDGAFFIGAYYEHEYEVFDGTNWVDWLKLGYDFSKIIVGNIDHSWSKPITLGLDLLEFGIDLGINLANMNSFEDVSVNSSSIGLQSFNTTRTNQIKNYGYLQKSIFLLVNKPENDAILRNNRSVYAVYNVNTANSIGTPKLTKLNSSIGVTISDKKGNKIIGDADSHLWSFGDDAPEEISLAHPREISLTPGAIKTLSFIPDKTGYYYFDTNGSNATNINIVSGAYSHLTVVRSGAKKIKVHLQGGMQYIVELSFVSDSVNSTFYFTVERSHISTGTTAITVQSNNVSSGDYYSLTVPNSGAYSIRANSSSVYFDLYDDDFNYITSSQSNELNNILQHGSTYYLRVRNKTTAVISCSLTIGSVTSVSEGAYRTISSNNDYRFVSFSAPTSGWYVVTLDSYSGNPEINLFGVTPTQLSSNGALVYVFYLSAGNEMQIKVKTNSSIRLKIDKTANVFQWEVNGVTQTGNEYYLKRGSSATVRLKVNGIYVNDVVSIPKTYFTYSNNRVALNYNMPMNTSADFVGLSNLDGVLKHSIFSVYPLYQYNPKIFSRYNEDSGYGLTWNPYSSSLPESFTAYYELKIGNTVLNYSRYWSSYSARQDLSTFLSTTYTSKVNDIIATVKYISVSGVKIYNSNWSGYQSLSTQDKKNNISSQSLTVNTFFGDGNGSSSNPYTINTFRHLNNLRNMGTSIGKHYKLTSNVYVPYSGTNYFWDTYWVMVPDDFYGTFDGNGMSIYRSNLVLTKTINTGKTNFGLFETNRGTIKNLTLRQSGTSSHQYGVDKTTTIYVGMVAGSNYGTIDNCHYDGSGSDGYLGMCIFYEKQYTGGIAGYNNGKIVNCTVDTDIEGYGHHGGIVGYNASAGTVEGCTTRGRILNRYSQDMLDGSTHYSAGGIAAINYGTVKYNYNYANVAFSAHNYFESRVLQPRMGQIIGSNFGSQYSNYCNGTVTKGELKVVTWKGGFLWLTTYTHDQTLYVSNGAVGY